MLSFRKASEEGSEAEFGKNSSDRKEKKAKEEACFTNLQQPCFEEKKKQKQENVRHKDSGDWMYEENFFDNEPLPEHFEKYLPNIKEESEHYGINSAWTSNRSIQVSEKRDEVQEIWPQSYSTEQRTLTVDRDTPDVLHNRNYMGRQFNIQKASTGESAPLHMMPREESLQQQSTANLATKEVQTDPLDIESLIGSVSVGKSSFSKKKDNPATSKSKFSAIISPRDITKAALGTYKIDPREKQAVHRKKAVSSIKTDSKNPLKHAFMEENLIQVMSNHEKKERLLSPNIKKRANVQNLKSFSRDPSPPSTLKRMKSLETKLDGNFKRRVVSPMKERGEIPFKRTAKEMSVSDLKSNKAEASNTSNTKPILESKETKRNSFAMTAGIKNTEEIPSNLFTIKFSKGPQSTALAKPKTKLFRDVCKKTQEKNWKNNFGSGRLMNSSSFGTQEEAEHSLCQNSLESNSNSRPNLNPNQLGIENQKKTMGISAGLGYFLF